jgi:predicted metal-dependent HD superfamily phosphohydrolase
VSGAALPERFGSLWKRMGAGDDGRSVCDALLRAYGEPHRRYHNLVHLRDCLGQLDEAPGGGADREPADRDLAETALWFHDAVYQPRADDNEARSADWATDALTRSGVAEGRAREVGRLVRLTDHVRPADEPRGALVCDVDLSILGRPPEEFAEYERRIRAENSRVPDPLYRAGRIAVLEKLLARHPLYRSEHFRVRYEATARQNLKRSLESLGAGSRAE